MFNNFDSNFGPKVRLKNNWKLFLEICNKKWNQKVLRPCLSIRAKIKASAKASNTGKRVIYYFFTFQKFEISNFWAYAKAFDISICCKKDFFFIILGQFDPFFCPSWILLGVLSDLRERP